MRTNFNTCRFCGDWKGEKVKYGVRHEAHLKCALAKQGMAFLRKLIAHPGLRWRLNGVTVSSLVDMLPAKERTSATTDELNALLGRTETA